MIYHFEIWGLNPIPKERARTGKGFHYTPERTEQFESTLKTLVQYQVNPYFDEIEILKEQQLGIIAHYIRRDKHPADVDNMTKSLKDGLQGVLWTNDRQVKGEAGYVSYNALKPGIILSVMPFEEWLERTTVMLYSGTLYNITNTKAKKRKSKKGTIEVPVEAQPYNSIQFLGA